MSWDMLVQGFIHVQIRLYKYRNPPPYTTTNMLQQMYKVVLETFPNTKGHMGLHLGSYLHNKNT
jgi:hypothetical protein